MDVREKLVELLADCGDTYHKATASYLISNGVYDWKVWRIITAMRSTKVMKKMVTHWQPMPQPPKGE